MSTSAVSRCVWTVAQSGARAYVKSLTVVASIAILSAYIRSFWVCQLFTDHAVQMGQGRGAQGGTAERLF